LIWIKAAVMAQGRIQFETSRGPAMVETLTARLLDRRTIDKAYPLVRNVIPGMTAARWTRFVRPQLALRSPDWPRGVMTIQNVAGYILSLFAFEVRADLHESRIFYMDHIMIPDLPGRMTIWASTVSAAERLAEMNRCGAVRAEFERGSEVSDKDLLMSFESMGYCLAGVRVFKRLEAKSGHSGDDGHGLARSPRGSYDA
jgi:hypothetical protein